MLGGGVKRNAGQEEGFSPQTHAQEVAELLGQAITNCNGEMWEDQAASTLTIYGTQFRFVVSLC